VPNISQELMHVIGINEGMNIVVSAQLEPNGGGVDLTHGMG